jgi:hypothetical protein
VLDLVGLALEVVEDLLELALQRKLRWFRAPRVRRESFTEREVGPRRAGPFTTRAP